MKKSHDIQFPNPDFPILIFPARVSIVDDVGEAARAIHESIEIKCFYEGCSTLLVGDQTITARAGDVIVINPYEFHATLDYGGEETGKYHLIMLNADFLSGIAADVDLRHMIFGRQLLFKNYFPADSELYGLLIQLSKETNNQTPDARLAIFGLVAQIFSILLRRGCDSRQNTVEDLSHYYALIEPAIRMIRDDYSSKFTVDELAAACSISKYHFCRIFKTVMGMSSIQYLNSYRLKIANTMLTNTDRRIGEIATLCGFEDAGYFCKIYKRHFGTTPRKK